MCTLAVLRIAWVVIVSRRISACVHVGFWRSCSLLCAGVVRSLVPERPLSNLSRSLKLGTWGLLRDPRAQRGEGVQLMQQELDKRTGEVRVLEKGGGCPAFLACALSVCTYACVPVRALSPICISLSSMYIVFLGCHWGLSVPASGACDSSGACARFTPAA